MRCFGSLWTDKVPHEVILFTCVKHPHQPLPPPNPLTILKGSLPCICTHCKTCPIHIPSQLALTLTCPIPSPPLLQVFQPGVEKQVKWSWNIRKGTGSFVWPWTLTYWYHPHQIPSAPFSGILVCPHHTQTHWHVCHQFDMAYQLVLQSRQSSGNNIHNLTLLPSIP